MGSFMVFDTARTIDGVTPSSWAFFGNAVVPIASPLASIPHGAKPKIAARKWVRGFNCVSVSSAFNTADSEASANAAIAANWISQRVVVRGGIFKGLANFRGSDYFMQKFSREGLNKD